MLIEYYNYWKNFFFYENPSKCSFEVQEVEHLGHVLSHEGVKVDPNKIKSMRESSIPKNLKKLRGFLVLIGYYCKFFKNYGQITTPLTTLLKKESFSWTEEETKYFEKLKGAMCTTPILATPDLFALFSSMCEQKVSAYMPSWALLVMTAVW
jgi:hypothetical protein